MTQPRIAGDEPCDDLPILGDCRRRTGAQREPLHHCRRGRLFGQTIARYSCAEAHRLRRRHHDQGVHHAAGQPQDRGAIRRRIRVVLHELRDEFRIRQVAGALDELLRFARGFVRQLFLLQLRILALERGGSMLPILLTRGGQRQQR
jgi:hypothetical protein